MSQKTPDNKSWAPLCDAPTDGSPVYVRGHNYGKSNQPMHYCWARWDGSNWIEIGSTNVNKIILTHVNEYLPLFQSTGVDSISIEKLKHEKTKLLKIIAEAAIDARAGKFSNAADKLENALNVFNKHV